MKNRLCDKIIDFNKNIDFSSELPEGFKVINPFLENPQTLKVMEQSYQKYYNDDDER